MDGVGGIKRLVRNRVNENTSIELATTEHDSTMHVRILVQHIFYAESVQGKNLGMYYSRPTEGTRVCLKHIRKFNFGK